MQTVIGAAKRLGPSSGVQFVLCGRGLRLDAYRKMAADCPHVVFPGWVNGPEIRALLEMSKLALTPYVDRVDYQGSISNKAIEYLSGGLPILTSLPGGILFDLLREHDCGACYDGDRQLAELVRSLQGSPRREEMSRNAARLFAERFTAAKVYGAMCDYLEEVAVAGRTSNGPAATRGAVA
jgi:glycosyltransferase involved in cell wall biosynthesis